MMLLLHCETLSHRNAVIQLGAQRHRLNLLHGAKLHVGNTDIDSSTIPNTFSAIQVGTNELVLPLLVPSETFKDSAVVGIVVHDDRHGFSPSSGLPNCFSRSRCWPR